jgi:carboxyl-terminal processing protease
MDVEAEAGRLTREFRQHDPYAKVVSTEKWRRRQYSNANALKVSLIRQPVPTGYIRIRDFYSNYLCHHFRQQIVLFKRHGVRQLILDVRGNPGGQRLVAVCIAGLLIGPGPIVGIKPIPPLIPRLDHWIDGVSDIEGETWWAKSFSKQETDLPLVLIQNQQSASAAEILAAALRDYNRAWITGTRSYGKGRAQEWLPMRDRPDLMMAHTISQFFSPQGQSPEGVGVNTTPLSEEMKACVAQSTRDTYRDSGLNHALAVLDCARR